MNRRRRPHSAPRRGTVLVMALACLVILGVLQVLLVQAAVARRRLSHEQAFRHQARWLAEAGIERAAARLAAEADYRGETWQVSAEELPPSGQRASEPASVEIEVQSATAATAATDQRSDDRANERMVRVRAAYPRDLPRRVVYEKQITVSLSRAR
jgi:Tfp pilus assembly protein PilX